ncbi:shock factor protein 4 [Seminavis robusta]|uniref:Shock factor protein 4 n=1 Tax=Seminavis robusta TaxID=568900 RepID=A0A9N8DA47_9STRA|nr:shock factor protein 4 [Seminavis robusta]|eukprot:Sro53_g031470.1 shock factor protein 4 (339) ;mRNA; f:96929-98343
MSAGRLPVVLSVLPMPAASPMDNGNVNVSFGAGAFGSQQQQQQQQQHGPNCNTNMDLQLASFPVKLHAMLSSIDLTGSHVDIVTWRPHGRLFVVKDRNRFINEVIPCWCFTMTSYASFQRQLNIYGFRSLSSGPDKGGYYHEMFLRGHPELATQIPRQKLKGKGPRKPATPHNEPNFYTMPPVTAPLPPQRAPPAAFPPPRIHESPMEGTTLGRLLFNDPSVLSRAVAAEMYALPTNSAQQRDPQHARNRVSSMNQEHSFIQPRESENLVSVGQGLEEELVELILENRARGAGESDTVVNISTNDFMGQNEEAGIYSNFDFEPLPVCRDARDYRGRNH